MPSAQPQLASCTGPNKVPSKPVQPFQSIGIKTDAPDFASRPLESPRLREESFDPVTSPHTNPQIETKRSVPENTSQKASLNNLPLKKLLIINPNTTESMSQGILDLVQARGVNRVFETTVYTATKGVASINDNVDAEKSAHFVIQEIAGLLQEYDGFLVACYSVHPLVAMIRELVDPSIPVIGIFEASILAAIALLPPRSECRPERGDLEGYETFGIVSTGNYWKLALTKGVWDFLGNSKYLKNGTSRNFKAVETTGLSAVELHMVDKDVVNQKLKEATKRLLKDRDCLVICLGCAGMAGMDDIVREAIVEELGEEEAQHIKIVDGVEAGLGWFEGILESLPDTEENREPNLVGSYLP